MTDLRTAAQQALDALERLQNAIYNIGGEHVTGLFVANAAADSAEKPMGTLRAALAQEQADPAQEPVAWMVYTEGGTSAYVTDNPNDLKEGQSAYALYPGPFERQPLTEEASSRLCDEYQNPRQLVRAVERAHGIIESEISGDKA